MRGRLDKIYLRFDCGARVVPRLIWRGLVQGKALGASHVRLVGDAFRDIGFATALLERIRSEDMEISADIPISKADEKTLGLARRYAEHIDLGIDFVPPEVPEKSPIYRGLLANVHASPENTSLLAGVVRKCLDEVGFGRVKLFAYAREIGDLERYFEAAREAQRLHDKYGDRLYSLYPTWLLSYRNLKLTRRVCSYQRTVAVLADGRAFVCNARVEQGDDLPSLEHQDLEDIMDGYEPLRRFYELTSDALKGVCAVCVFRSYCANVCPAMVFNHTGSFEHSFPDCQYIYDQGGFPSEYLLSSIG